MAQDPYANKLLDQAFPCKEKSIVRGRVNCVLHARAEQRGLELSPFPSRAVLKGDIHELILTAEENAGPGKKVDCIAYIAFFEIEEGGILWSGDRVTIAGQTLGTLAGYDMTHFPNHMNIILRAAAPIKTGFENGFHVGAPISFELP